MTLEECIDYAEEQSKWMSKYAMIDIYKDRSEYYQQLADWLRELKDYRDDYDYRTLKIKLENAEDIIRGLQEDLRDAREELRWR